MTQSYALGSSSLIIYFISVFSVHVPHAPRCAPHISAYTTQRAPHVRLTHHAHLFTRAHAPHSHVPHSFIHARPRASLAYCPPSFLCDLRHPHVLSKISTYCLRSPRIPESPLLQCISNLVFMVTVYVLSLLSYAHSYSINSYPAHYILPHSS